MKKLFNFIAGVGFVQWIVAAIVWFGIKFVFITSTKSIKNKEIITRDLKGKPIVFAFWHGRSMVLSPLVKRLGIDGYAVSSVHRDGRLMAKIQKLFGLKTIWGSTHRNSLSVLRESVRVLRAGHSVCITPDGPKGPRMMIKDGILYFSKITGAPIVPICWSSSKVSFRRSWDKYAIAKPFGKIQIEIGNPVYVPRGATDDEMDEIKLSLEKFMVGQTQDLDAAFGWKRISQGIKKKR